MPYRKSKVRSHRRKIHPGVKAGILIVACFLVISAYLMPEDWIPEPLKPYRQNDDEAFAPASSSSPAREKSHRKQTLPADIRVVSLNLELSEGGKVFQAEAMADVLTPNDMIVVQGSVLPASSTQPQDSSLSPASSPAKKLSDALSKHGFQSVTAAPDKKASSSRDGVSDWWAFFYRSEKILPASDLPQGYLPNDGHAQGTYDRIPWAVGFRTPNRQLDLVVIPVDLQAGKNRDNLMLRKQELLAVGDWILSNDEKEKDFLIMGNLRVEDAVELSIILPMGFSSLNDICRATNTNIRRPRPNVHVLFRPDYSPEVDQTQGITVVNLVHGMRATWHGEEAFPGEQPYDDARFRQYYGGQNPIEFVLNVPPSDDD